MFIERIEVYRHTEWHRGYTKNSTVLRPNKFICKNQKEGGGTFGLYRHNFKTTNYIKSNFINLEKYVAEKRNNIKNTTYVYIQTIAIQHHLEYIIIRTTGWSLQM